MLVSRVPYSFLAPSIAFIASNVMAWPLPGAPYPVIGTRRDSRFRDPLKFAQLFDSSVQMVSERVSAFQLLW